MEKPKRLSNWTKGGIMRCIKIPSKDGKMRRLTESEIKKSENSFSLFLELLK